MADRLATRVLKPRSSQQAARVSVVIPCYNYGEYLPAAVRSVLEQPSVDVDVIIVDDHSVDDSLAVARALAAKDERVSVLYNEVNRGAVDTFNRGLANVTGEYVVRLDADDMLTPGSLERAVAVMQALPSVGLVYGHPIHFSGEALPKPREVPRAWYLWRGAEWLAARCAAGTNVITAPEVVMRKSIVDLVGGQRDLAHTHDMEMWLRIASRSDVVYIAGADQAFHREHAKSLSMQARNPMVILSDTRRAFEVLFDGSTVGGADGTSLHEIARAAVAMHAVKQAARFADRGVSNPAADELLDFARSTSPAVTRTREWNRVTRALTNASTNARRRRVTRALGIVPRFRRRFADAQRSRRWERGGVYEPIRLQRAGEDDRTHANRGAR